MYQLVSQEPSKVRTRATARSLPSEVGPSHHSTRTAMPITITRDSAHARTGTRQRGHHAARVGVAAVVVATARCPVLLADTPFSPPPGCRTRSAPGRPG